MTANPTEPKSTMPPRPTASLSLIEQERMIEAILFASAEPLSLRAISSRLPDGCDVAEALETLRARYQGRGVQLGRVGDSWAFRTAPDLGFLMQEATVESRGLSRAATETLAIIAYHQPVTRTEIEEIRGVALSRGTLDQLIELDWVRVGRRRQTPGRPATFIVTETFLDHFGLESARDLPGLAELRAAGLLESRPPAAAMPVVAGDDDADGMVLPQDLYDDE
ncbi:SMC-Scp complex subunit ScpB [Paracoccus sp. KR1-242]